MTFCAVLWIGVSRKPGQRAVTLTPYCLASDLRLRERPTMACLAVL